MLVGIIDSLWLYQGLTAVGYAEHVDACCCVCSILWWEARIVRGRKGGGKADFPTVSGEKEAPRELSQGRVPDQEYSSHTLHRFQHFWSIQFLEFVIRTEW